MDVAESRDDVVSGAAYANPGSARCSGRLQRLAKAIARRVVVAMPEATVSLDLDRHPTQTRNRVGDSSRGLRRQRRITELPGLWR